MTTPIAELTQNYPLAFEVIWAGLGAISFFFILLASSAVKREERIELIIASLWCLGASILVLLASV